MLGGHHHVAHAGLARQPRPCPRHIARWLKLPSQLFVFLERDVFIAHDPRFAAQNGVEAPMNEHSELCLAPPLDAALMIWRWNVSWHGRCACKCRRLQTS